MLTRLPQSLALVAALTLAGCTAPSLQSAAPSPQNSASSTQSQAGSPQSLATSPPAQAASPAETKAEARNAARAQRAAVRSEMETARQQLDQIPPPSKNRYLAVHSVSAWSNPFISVHPSTVTLRIFYPDRTPDAFGTGGMLRPANARKQELEVRLADLPTALSALPEEVWPYGRVVAVEESPNAPKPERIAIRRNVEATIQVLNDLGVVVDEWTGPGGSLLR